MYGHCSIKEGERIDNLHGFPMTVKNEKTNDPGLEYPCIDESNPKTYFNVFNPQLSNYYLNRILK